MEESVNVAAFTRIIECLELLVIRVIYLSRLVERIVGVVVAILTSTSVDSSSPSLVAQLVRHTSSLFKANGLVSRTAVHH